MGGDTGGAGCCWSRARLVRIDLRVGGGTGVRGWWWLVVGTLLGPEGTNSCGAPGGVWVCLFGWPGFACRIRRRGFAVAPVGVGVGSVGGGVAWGGVLVVG
jgi:hypothetical protein